MKKGLLYLGVALILAFSPPASATGRPSVSHASVRYVVDGDTFLLSNGEKVRLIGIDAPESRENAKLERDLKHTRKSKIAVLAMGKQASKFVRRLLKGKKVRLEYDSTLRDDYGRLLAYVYLEDGTFVNAEIVKAGYAKIMTIPPNVKYASLFSSLQREARENHRGLWG